MLRARLREYLPAAAVATSYVAVALALDALKGEWVLGTVHRHGNVQWLELIIALGVVGGSVFLWDIGMGPHAGHPTRAERAARGAVASLFLLAVNLVLFSLTMFAHAISGDWAFDTVHKHGTEWVVLDLLTGLTFVLAARIAWRLARQRQRTNRSATPGRVREATAGDQPRV